MRIFAAGGPQTETNTFCPIPTTLEMFSESYLKYSGEDPDNTNFWSLPNRVWSTMAREKGYEYFDGLRAGAEPAGPVKKDVYEFLRDEMLKNLRDVMPVDMVLLNLHGAMIADGYEDCEGDIIEKTREIVGLNVPIGVELDLHANLTERMVKNANIIILFKEYPHTDVADRAVEVFNLTELAAKEKIKPSISVANCNMINLFPTTSGDMQNFVNLMKNSEKSISDVLSVSLVHGFPWADVKDLGAKVLVITNENKKLGDKLANDLANSLYQQRKTLAFRLTSLQEAINILKLSQEFPIIFGDFSDNPGGGGVGDATFILKEIIEQIESPSLFVTIWDPDVVEEAFACGIGSNIPVSIGGKHGKTSGTPVECIAKVIKLKKELKQKLDDVELNLGDSAALQIGNHVVIINSARTQIYTDTPIIEMGLNPKDFSLIVVKSSVHFEACYKKYGKTIRVATPGALNSNFSMISYEKADKTLWPLSDSLHPIKD